MHHLSLQTCVLGSVLPFSYPFISTSPKNIYNPTLGRWDFFASSPFTINPGGMSLPSRGKGEQSEDAAGYNRTSLGMLLLSLCAGPSK